MSKIIKTIGVHRIIILFIFVVIFGSFPELWRWPVGRLGILENYDTISDSSIRTVLKWLVIGLISGVLSIVAPWLGVLLGLDAIFDSGDGGFFDGDGGEGGGDGM